MSSDLLVVAARRLQPVLPELTFVGGQVAPLLLTIPATTAPRPTTDVDVVVATETYTRYSELEDRLQKLGMRRDTRPDAPICRWLTPEDVEVDVMPADSAVLGFSNRW